MKQRLGLAALFIVCIGLAQETAETSVQALPIRKWQAIGPFGHPELKDRPNAPHPAWPAHNFVSKIYAEKAKYPLDEIIDLSAAYKGDLTKNCAAKELEVKWEPAKGKAGVVTWPKSRKLARGVGLCYFSTWIRVPEETTILAAFPAYGKGRQAVAKFGASTKVWINGKTVKLEQTHPDNPWLFHPLDEQEITLKAGWNHVYVKVFSTWSGCRAGLVLKGKEDVLWQVKTSPTPPAEVGKYFTISGEKAEPPKKPPARPAEKKPDTPARTPGAPAKVLPAKARPKKEWSF